MSAADREAERREARRAILELLEWMEEHQAVFTGTIRARGFNIDACGAGAGDTYQAQVSGWRTERIEV